MDFLEPYVVLPVKPEQNASNPHAEFNWNSSADGATAKRSVNNDIEDKLGAGFRPDHCRR
jgi:hypothetical protein